MRATSFRQKICRPGVWHRPDRIWRPLNLQAEFTTFHEKRDDTMGFFGFLLLGLLAGAIAKLILPGKQGGGWFITLLLGVVGALLGGFLGGLLFNAPLED